MGSMCKETKDNDLYMLWYIMVAVESEMWKTLQKNQDPSYYGGGYYIVHGVHVA